MMARQVVDEQELRRLRTHVLQHGIERKFPYVLGLLDAKLIFHEPSVVCWINDSCPLTTIVAWQMGAGYSIYSSNPEQLRTMLQQVIYFIQHIFFTLHYSKNPFI